MRSSPWMVGLLGVLLWGGGARAAGLGEFQGQLIDVVRFEGSGISDVHAQIDIRPGDLFSKAAIRRAVKLLYNLGLFGQVRVTAFPGKNGVALTFHLVPQRRVLSVQFIGNEVASSTELLRLTRFNRGDEFDRWKVESATAEIRALYRRRGYRRTQIINKFLGPEEGDVAIRVFVQEGPPTRISKLSFKGQALLDPPGLSKVMGLEEGATLDEERLQEAIERLLSFYRKQGYLEARVVSPKLEHELQALWAVVPIEIAAGKRVAIAFSGNEVFSSRQLLAEIKTDRGIQLNESTLGDLCGRLEDYCRQHGHAKARVTYFVVVGPTQKWITFAIDEGPRVTVRAILFDGNRAFSQGQLRGIIEDAMLDAIPQSLLGQPIDRGDVDVFGGGYPLREQRRRAIRPQGFLFELRPETVFLRRPYEKALEEIQDLYRSQGYLDVQVEEPLLSFDDSGSNLYITIPIQEGQQTRIESISFEGNRALDSDQLLRIAEQRSGSVRPGGPLNTFAVEELRKALAQAYAQKGYVYSQVEQKVRFSPDRSLAEIQYLFFEGPLVKVRRILVRGNVVTGRPVFDRTLAIHQGSVFAPDKVAESQEDLLDLGIFSAVDLKMLDPDLPEAEKDVVVSVRERLPHSLTFSPGVSSAEGVRAELDYSHLNLFGNAVELVGKAKVNYQIFYPFLSSEIRDRYERMSFAEGLEGWMLAGLHWPRLWWFGKNVSARVDLVGLQDHAISYDLTKISLVPGIDLNLGSGLALALQFELEHNTLSCTLVGESCGGATADRWMRYDQGTLFLGNLRPELSWDRRDNPFRPHRGTLVSFRPELAKSLSPERPAFFLKLDGLFSAYMPLGRELTLALSVRAGAILHLESDKRTPSHKLFFLGGRNTVRGYQEDALIPQDLDPPCVSRVGDSTNQVCVSPGGNAYLNFKGEFRFPLIPETVEGALFLDLGNLWIQSSNMNLFELRPATGFGMRLVTPIGPIALDFGINLNPDSQRHEDQWNLHFNIGVF